MAEHGPLEPTSGDVGVAVGFNQGIRAPRSRLRADAGPRLPIRAILDHLAVVGLLFLHTWVKTGGFETQYQVLATITVLLMATLYPSLRVYATTNRSRLEQVAAMTRGWLVVLVALIALGFVTKTSSTFSREVMLTWSITGWLGQFLVFLVHTRFVAGRSAVRSKRLATLVVGSGPLADHLYRALDSQPDGDEQVIGFIADEPGGARLPVPRLGAIDELAEVVDRHAVRRVFVALPLEQAGRLQAIQLSLIDRPVDLIWVPDLLAVNLLNHSIREFAGMPLISLTETPLRGPSAWLKSIFDRSLALFGVIALAPLLITVAILVKLSSPGPVLFKQKRHGFDGQVFEVWKFRSMYLHDDDKVVQARRDDDRITPIGRFIRRTSIDELPQLFNVLNGTMSLVGPRPHALAHNAYYGDKIQAYFQRHRIKPGLTGLAQVNGCRGETDTLEKMQRRVEYDLSYISNWSIWLDLRIIARTLLIVLRDPHAY